MDTVRRKEMAQKTILVTGGAGYVGSRLVSKLLRDNYRVKVLDRLFFGPGSILEHLNDPNFELIKNDTRHTDKKHFRGVDTVIDLAGISNDPSCEIDPCATQEINHKGAAKIAKMAKEAGVNKFIFSSSCSVYGHGEGLSLTEESTLNPVSLYAQCKIAAEEEILKLNSKNFTVTILRNATVYGLSKRMRFDLVVNLMTLNAFQKRKIYIIGGGQQWRPNVHLGDVVKAFLSVMGAGSDKVSGQVFNVGSNEQNYQIIQVARMVKDIFSDTVIEDVPSDPDQRNYNVNFDKIKKVLGFSAQKDIKDGVREVKEGLENGVITYDIKTRTLDYYKYLLEANEVIKEVSLDGKIF